MKTDLDPLKPRTPKRVIIAPWVCVMTNLAAFPGLGTIMARRRGGYLQALIMVAGFILTMMFFAWYVAGVIQLLKQGSTSRAEFTAVYRPHLWALYYGLGLCLVAWVWSLFSSLQILKTAKREPVG